ncbi:MAG TPA: phosphatase PAP2 family protein [Gemmatimonadaceae bacterium]|nr:phosphatase PAP2 family protein [Gemmatimonadaceae bacterium]
MGRSRWTAILAAVCAPAIAAAQNIPKDFAHDLRFGVHDFFSVWKAPFTGSPRDYATAGLVLGGVGLSALADRPVGDWFRDHQSSSALDIVKPFRGENRIHFVNIGAGHYLAQGAAAVYVVGLFTRQAGLRDAGMGCLAAEQAQAIPRGFLAYKYVRRERPLFQDVVNGDTVRRPGDPYDVTFPGKTNWYDHSFFGGHVANLTACVEFVTKRFHLSYAEPVMWAAVAGLGVARMADQRHWLSDELLGVAVGYASGKYVAERSRARRDKRMADKEGRASPDTGSSWLDHVYFARGDRDVLIGWRRPF